MCYTSLSLLWWTLTLMVNTHTSLSFHVYTHTHTLTHCVGLHVPLRQQMLAPAILPGLPVISVGLISCRWTDSSFHCFHTSSRHMARHTCNALLCSRLRYTSWWIIALACWLLLSFSLPPSFSHTFCPPPPTSPPVSLVLSQALRSCAFTNMDHW